MPLLLQPGCGAPRKNEGLFLLTAALSPSFSLIQASAFLLSDVQTDLTSLQATGENAAWVCCFFK